MNIYQEFKASLKDTSVEEAVDLFFFRPIAYALVKVLIHLPITPNQISVLSMVAGIIAGVFFSFGDRKSFLIAGILYAVSHILDCCDGMIARLKKNGTPIGRIIDGWADYITSISVYVGLIVGLQKGVFALPVPASWMLVVPAGFFLALHGMIVDYYRHEFMAHALGKTNTIREDLDMFSQELERFKKEGGHYLERLLISVYIGYTSIQLNKNGDEKHYNQEEYLKSNKLLLALWNWIGASTHIFMLMLSALFFEPMIFFYYVLGAANVWMLVVGFFQIRTNRRIALKT